MARFRLHCFAQSGNANKVALYLSLAGLDWEPVFVDFFNGETRRPAWRAAVNEMGEVPVLEYGGRKHTQSGLILLRLARETGALAPVGGDAADQALRWILFDNHKFSSQFATYRFLKSLAPTPPDPAVLAFLKGRVDSAFAIVEAHLADRPFMLGDQPTVADLSLAGYLFYPVDEHGYDFPTSHPAMAAWLGRLRALPGWKHPYALMPGHPLPGR